MYLTYHMLQEQLLVGCLYLREVALDAVELRAVGHVEDLRDVQLLEEQLRASSLVNGEVVEEEGEVGPAELASELPNECDEGLRVDGQRVDGEVDEAPVLTDGGDERQSLNFQIGVVDPHPVPLVGPALGPERSKREHRLVQVDDSGLRLVYLIHQLVHAVE